MDAVHGVQGGNVRALGIANSACVITLICYYLIGIPMSIMLTFYYEMGLLGLWLGYLFAMALIDVIMVFRVMNADWKANFILKPKTDGEKSNPLL